mmetsp:Transcript_42207/g.75810  ORF Transcript_42207/g.75810 Transcript_42207/m.75810 type:complete len:200 (+) Transcript_42207:633-1232(+)
MWHFAVTRLAELFLCKAWQRALHLHEVNHHQRQREGRQISLWSTEYTMGLGPELHEECQVLHRRVNPHVGLKELGVQHGSSIIAGEIDIHRLCSILELQLEQWHSGCPNVLHELEVRKLLQTSQDLQHGSLHVFTRCIEALTVASDIQVGASDAESYWPTSYWAYMPISTKLTLNSQLQLLQATHQGTHLRSWRSRRQH